MQGIDSIKCHVAVNAYRFAWFVCCDIYGRRYTGGRGGVGKLYSNFWNATVFMTHSARIISLDTLIAHSWDIVGIRI